MLKARSDPERQAAPIPGSSVPAHLSMSIRKALGDVESYESTRRYYDENARNYADATRSLPLSEALEPFVARLESGARVLDLGCGAGRDLRALSLRGVRPVGLDVSLPLAEMAAEYSQCSVVQGDLRALPFGDAAFGGIWASASLLHLRREDVQLALREARRVLHPHGYFFSSVKRGAGEGPDSRGRWFTYFAPGEWLSMLADAGFTVIDTNASGQVPGTLEREVSVDWFNCTAQS